MHQISVRYPKSLSLGQDVLGALERGAGSHEIDLVFDQTSAAHRMGGCTNKTTNDRFDDHLTSSGTPVLELK